MPVELPGFYFDTERNRYFPLASKPKPSRTDAIAPQGSQRRNPAGVGTSKDSSTPPQAKSLSPVSLKRARHKSRWSLTQFSRSTCDESKRIRAMHEIRGRHYANSTCALVSLLPTSGLIKSFAGTIYNGEFQPFVGDSRGWLWTPGMISSGQTIWAQELSLEWDSEVKSISISGSKVAATSFGPAPRVAIRDMAHAGRTTLIALKGIRDVWSSHLYNKTLVMGADRCLVSLEDIELSSSIRRMGTDSDTFTVLQQEHLIYAGCRNGSILRFDTREQEDNKSPRYIPLYKPQTRAPTSVVHIDNIGEHQMLVSMLNDKLMAIDLRYIKPEQPVMRFEGHRNAYTPKLGIAMDPTQQYLFAAGDDNRIRAWSLHSGQPLTPPSYPTLTASDRESSWSSNSRSVADVISPNTYAYYDPPQETNFLTKTFPDTISCMQVIDHAECSPGSASFMGGRWAPGLALWAGCEKTLYQFPLGQSRMLGPRTFGS